MKRLVKVGIIIFVSFLAGILFVVGFVYFGLRGIPESHIEGNVPDEKVFHEYLVRDLTTYFMKRYNQDISVSAQLLSNNIDQAGLGVPKFYAWVVITDSLGNEVIDEGVVRVGANAKENFTVMAYFSVESIKQDQNILRKATFPSDVMIKIKQRIE